MLELKTFLDSINAEETFKRLERNPSTLYLEHKHSVWRSEDNLSNLFNLLKATEIKSLVFIGLFAMIKCPILLAKFLIDPECRITNIKIDSSFIDPEKLAIILEAFKINNTLQEIDLSNTKLTSVEFYNFLASISQKPNLKVLSLPNVSLSVPDDWLVYSNDLTSSLSEFLNNSNVNSLTLNRCFTQEDIITLLPLIKAKNSKVFLNHDYTKAVFEIRLSYKHMSLSFFQPKKSPELFRDYPIHALDMRGFYLNDVGVAAISYFLERNNYTISLSFSLASEISKESIEKLLTSIRNSKVISCSIKQEQGIFGGGKEQEKQLSKEIREITAINLNKIKRVSEEIVKEAAKEIIPILRNFYEKKLKLVDCKADSETCKYLKLYQNLHLKKYLKELKINYDNLDAITQNADDYINRHFFEMVGIAKNSTIGYFPLEIMSRITSYLKLSDILLVGKDTTDIDWVVL